MKVILQGIVLVALFFLTLLGLRQVNWMHAFRVQQVADRTEKELGDMLWKDFKANNEEIDDPKVKEVMDSILTRICTKNNLDKKQFNLHVVKNDMVNAFALPAGHLVIFTGLLEAADNAEEITGVLCHEMAHINHNHVMKKLVKEIGMGAVISASTGGVEVLREAAGVLSSTAFDRSLEKEADLAAVEYLTKAQIDPEPFANFLYKLGSKETDMMRYLSWVSTHPQSKERAAYVMEHIKGKTFYYSPVVSDDSWQILKNARKTSSYSIDASETP